MVMTPLDHVDGVDLHVAQMGDGCGRRFSAPANGAAESSC